MWICIAWCFFIGNSTLLKFDSIIHGAKWIGNVTDCAMLLPLTSVYATLLFVSSWLSPDLSEKRMDHHGYIRVDSLRKRGTLGLVGKHLNSVGQWKLEHDHVHDHRRMIVGVSTVVEGPQNAVIKVKQIQWRNRLGLNVYTLIMTLQQSPSGLSHTYFGAIAGTKNDTDLGPGKARSVSTVIILCSKHNTPWPFALPVTRLSVELSQRGPVHLRMILEIHILKLQVSPENARVLSWVRLLNVWVHEMMSFVTVEVRRKVWVLHPSLD